MEKIAVNGGINIQMAVTLKQIGKRLMECGTILIIRDGYVQGGY
ncbi:hypothetical protein [uncultured Clostridium sp.]|nr:hypothetical protein [uncultured Clostridium sp.]